MYLFQPRTALSQKCICCSGTEAFSMKHLYAEALVFLQDNVPRSSIVKTRQKLEIPLISL
jgi:hypothetical protein